MQTLEKGNIVSLVMLFRDKTTTHMWNNLQNDSMEYELKSK